MIGVNLPAAPALSPAVSARARFEQTEGRPLFLADWDRVLFMHFAVDAEVLQPHVPLSLDLYRGSAYVSLVAFTQRRLRFAGGRAGAWVARPLAEHGFLNLRTYVRTGPERGIFFNVEWVPNRLACLLGPRLYGLPYRLARLDYRHDAAAGQLRGRVSAGRELRYEGRLEQSRLDASSAPAVCASESLDEFLLERYVAFTQRRDNRGDRRRAFRIWHNPWRQVKVESLQIEGELVTAACPWFSQARLIGANYSDGVEDVWIGRPQDASGREPFASLR